MRKLYHLREGMKRWPNYLLGYHHLVTAQGHASNFPPGRKPIQPGTGKNNTLYLLWVKRHRGIVSMIHKPGGIQLATALCVDTTSEDKPLAPEVCF